MTEIEVDYVGGPAVRAAALGALGPRGLASPSPRMPGDAGARLTADLGKPVRATDDWQGALIGADIPVEASRPPDA